MRLDRAYGIINLSMSSMLVRALILDCKILEQ